MRVYRIEDINGIGPYAGYEFNGCGGHHPTPDEEGFPDVCSDDYFGFDSLFQLCKWFGPVARQRLATLKYEVAVYDVEDQDITGQSPYQVMFKKRNANIKSRMQLR